MDVKKTHVTMRLDHELTKCLSFIGSIGYIIERMYVITWRGGESSLWFRIDLAFEFVFEMIMCVVGEC